MNAVRLRRRVGADGAQELEPIHLGHVEVRDHEMRRPRLESLIGLPAERFADIERNRSAAALRARAAHRQLIVDDKRLTSAAAGIINAPSTGCLRKDDRISGRSCPAAAGARPRRSRTLPSACRRPRGWPRPGRRCGAGLAHRQQARGAVAAHAGQDDAEPRAPAGGGDGVEQHVHRRAVAVDRIGAIEAAAQGRRPSPPGARRRRAPDRPGLGRRRAVAGLGHVGPAQASQPRGEARGEGRAACAG